MEKVLSVLGLGMEEDDEPRYGEFMTDIRVQADEGNQNGNRKMAYFEWTTLT